MDLDGDDRIDLIHSADIDRVGGIIWGAQSNPHWRVYFGTDSGFSPHYVEWSVPDSGLSDGFFYPFWNYGERFFASFDIDGDSLIDLVQTANPAERGGVVWRDEQGPYWLVWIGTSRGFHSEAIRWRVPESGLSDGFFATNWSQSGRHFRTHDLNRDGRPDLVQTARPSAEANQVHMDSHGPYWKVWHGTASGFETTASRWRVPHSDFEAGFYSFNQSHDKLWFATLDMSNDALPDLVKTGTHLRANGFVESDEQGAFWRIWDSH